MDSRQTVGTVRARFTLSESTGDAQTPLPDAPRIPPVSQSKGASPRLANMLAAQFADGFGARFHGVLLGLYALHLGGLAGFAGFAAASLVGAGLAAVVGSVATSRLGGARTMRAAGVALMVTRGLSYALIPLGLPLSGLLVLRLLGAVAGTVLVSGAKAQVRPGERSRSALAWLNIASGAGQAIAAVLAGFLSFASPLLIALVGAPIGLAATLPMLRIARGSTDRAVPLRDQMQGLRHAAEPILVGAGVFLVLNALPMLADGITADLYSPSWLGAISAVSFAGALCAALVLCRFGQRQITSDHDASLWAGLAALGVLGWVFADQAIVWMLVARFAAGFAAQILAALVESRVIERSGPGGGLPALTASGAVAAFGGAATTPFVPALLDGVGFVGVVSVGCAALAVLVLGATGARRYGRARRRRATPAAGTV